MRRTFLILALLVSAIALGPARVSAATITVPGGPITATSVGSVSVIKGATAIQKNVTLTGTVSNAVYAGVTLGVTTILPIGSITSGTCTSITAGWVSFCSLFPWPISARITGTNTAELRILRLGPLIRSTDGSVQCLISADVTGTYDRTTGLFVVTGTTTNSEARLVDGACPLGTISIRATLRVSPTVIWQLLP